MAQLTNTEAGLLIGSAALLAWLVSRPSRAATAPMPAPPAPSGPTTSYTYNVPLPPPLQRMLPADVGTLSLAARADVLRVLRAQLDLLGYTNPDVYAAGNAFLAAHRYNRPLGQLEGEYIAWLAAKVDETLRASRGLPAPTGRY